MKLIFNSRLFITLALCLSIFTGLSSCQEETISTSLLDSPDNPVVRMKTSEGDIFIELYQDEAPISVDNFLSYVKSGFYSGTIFHRVIDGFMIQGGGMLPGLEQKKPYAPIKNEADNGLSNLPVAQFYGKNTNDSQCDFSIFYKCK